MQKKYMRKSSRHEFFFFMGWTEDDTPRCRPRASTSHGTSNQIHAYMYFTYIYIYEGCNQTRRPTHFGVRIHFIYYYLRVSTYIRVDVSRNECNKVKKGGFVYRVKFNANPQCVRACCG